jgi:hypothetical protein
LVDLSALSQMDTDDQETLEEGNGGFRSKRSKRNQPHLHPHHRPHTLFHIIGVRTGKRLNLPPFFIKAPQPHADSKIGQRDPMSHEFIFLPFWWCVESPNVRVCYHTRTYRSNNVLTAVLLSALPSIFALYFLYKSFRLEKKLLKYAISAVVRSKTDGFKQ